MARARTYIFGIYFVGQCPRMNNDHSGGELGLNFKYQKVRTVFEIALGFDQLLIEKTAAQTKDIMCLK